MKKLITMVAVFMLAALAVPTFGQATDTNEEIKTKLVSKGIREVVSVHTGIDTIQEWDENSKPFVREPRQTVTIDLKYKKSAEVNDKYGDAINEVYGNTLFYKTFAHADYLKINIYRGQDLVAYMAINEKNERSIHILDQTHIAAEGMGISLPPEVLQSDRKLKEKVKKDDL